MRPLLCHGYAHFLETYQLLPTVGVLPTPDGQWDDLSLYLLFLGENIGELKSFKYIKVRLAAITLLWFYFHDLQINRVLLTRQKHSTAAYLFSVFRFYLLNILPVRTLTIQIFLQF